MRFHSMLSFKFQVLQVVDAYNNVIQPDRRIAFVGHSEKPWCANPAVTRIERKVYLAPEEKTFRSKQLNDIVDRLEMLFGSQVQDVVYFCYFYRRLAMGWLDIGGIDKRFRYRFGKVTSFTAESVASDNQVLLFPSKAIARDAHQRGINENEQLINMDFTQLRSHGFDPQIHLNKEELQWQEVKDNDR